MTDEKIVEIWDKAYTSSKPIRETLLDIYEKGRADAFHEVITEMCKSPFADEKVSITKRYIQEQLEENK